VDLIHSVPYAAIAFLLAAIALFFVPPRLMRRPRRGAEGYGAGMRTYTRRVTVYRSASVGLLILAVISYPTA